jgi:AcrR family transcriptional regulator
MREGRGPSMPEAADRALVSVATAYRYFTTAEELWEEAAAFRFDDLIDIEAVERAVAAEGDDGEGRLEAVVRGVGWCMLDHELPFRQAAKTSLDRWFAQQRAGGEFPGRAHIQHNDLRLGLERLLGFVGREVFYHDAWRRGGCVWAGLLGVQRTKKQRGGGEKRPTRPGQRNRWNALAVEPLRGALTDDEIDGLIEALGLAWGTEAAITLYDVLELEPEAAKQRMLTTCKWILRGALADARATARGSRRSPSSAARSASA